MPLRHRKSFLIENITNLAHSYLAKLCVDSGVEAIDKGKVRAMIKSLRLKSKSGVFSLDEFKKLNLKAEHISGFIIKRLEAVFIKDIYARAKARLQDIQAQIKLKENALKEQSLLYDLQMAKIQAILNKMEE